MSKNNYWKKYKEARNFYKTLEKIHSPVFDKDIYFSGKGFNHILRKGPDIRPIKDQLRRFGLLKHVPDIISDKNISNFTKITSFVDSICFVEYRLNKILKVRLIFYESQGRIHFLSIMNIKN